MEALYKEDGISQANVDQMEFSSQVNSLKNQYGSIPVQQLRSDAIQIIRKNRTEYLLQRNSVDFSMIKQNYANGRDVPNGLISGIIQKTAHEEGWNNFIPDACFVKSILFNEAINVNSITYENEDDVDIQIIEPDSTVPKGALDEYNEAGIHQTSECGDQPKCEEAIVKHEQLDTFTEESQDISSAVVKHEIKNEAEMDTSDEKIRDEALHSVFKYGIRGPLNPTFKRSAITALGIDSSFHSQFNDIDFSLAIPAVLRDDTRVVERIKAELQTFIKNQILYRRFSIIAKKNARLFAKLRATYNKETLSPRLLEDPINRVAKEEGWSTLIPTPQTVKSRLLQCSVAFYKSMAQELEDKGSLRNALDQFLPKSNENTPEDTKQERARIESLLNQATEDELEQEGDSSSPHSRAKGNILPSTSQARRFVRSSYRKSAPAVLRRPLVCPGVGRHLTRSAQHMLRQATSEDVSSGEGEKFISAMRSKIKDMSPEAVDAMMSRINEHIREKLISRIATQIITNFDPHEHSQIFNEILGIASQGSADDKNPIN